MHRGIKRQNRLGNARAEGKVGAAGPSQAGRRRRRPQADKAPLAPPFWCPFRPRRAGGTRRIGPAAPPSQPRRPRPSPSSSRWMMLSMLSLSISAIASQRPGGAFPAAPLAAWPARLGSSFCLVFALSCSAPSLALSAPPRPLSTEPALNKMAAVPSAGSPGARILYGRDAARRKPFIGRAGRAAG